MCACESWEEDNLTPSILSQAPWSLVILTQDFNFWKIPVRIRPCSVVWCVYFRFYHRLPAITMEEQVFLPPKTLTQRQRNARVQQQPGTTGETTVLETSSPPARLCQPVTTTTTTIIIIDRWYFFKSKYGRIFKRNAVNMVCCFGELNHRRFTTSTEWLYGWLTCCSRGIVSNV